MNKGWYGVDLDGTLAHYEGWQGPSHIGEPVPLMLAHVKKLLAEGQRVKIFTARVFFGVPGDYSSWDTYWKRQSEAAAAGAAIQAWCRKHLGEELEVTCVKDFGMIELWDDRAKGVRHNEGIFI